MSRAYQSFEYGIKDAEELLAHFDAINANPPPANAEVLKRAGLVMALTAWETYVEDRLLEEMNKKLGVVAGSYVGDFVLKKLHTDLKQFHTYSDPARDPRHHTVSTVFTAAALGFPQAGDDAGRAEIFEEGNLPPLVFDHGVILRDYFGTRKQS